jgi:phosphoribosylformylglycinamidine synthase
MGSDSVEKALLYRAVTQLTWLVKKLGFAIDGGKDSLSMGEGSPRSIVISGYANCLDIRNTIQPIFQEAGNLILLIEPTNSEELATTWKMMQDPNVRQYILSGHDRSDGGLATTLVEMSLASNGITFDIHYDSQYLLSDESLGIVVEWDIQQPPFNGRIIGQTTDDGVIMINDEIYSPDHLFAAWDLPSYEMEQMEGQSGPEQANIEREWLLKRIPLKISDIEADLFFHNDDDGTHSHPRVCVLRDFGSNGDNEMVYAFKSHGFIVDNIHTSDLLLSNVDMSVYTGIVLVGGFTYMDVFSGGSGWAEVLKKVGFKRNANQFILGICNG